MRPWDSASMVRAISPVHHRDDLPGDDGEDDAGADRAEEKNRQREAKSGGAKELTERRHESCNRRREPC